MHFSYFSSEVSNVALFFEVLIGLTVVSVIYYGMRYYRFFLWRFFALSFGVFCFEGLTGSLWNIEHLGRYAYIHNDISWIMTLMWTSMIFIIRFIYDSFVKEKTLIKEFTYIVVGGSVFSALILIFLQSNGIFGYSKTIQDTLSYAITLFGEPLEVIIYIPTFICTTYSFYKYWELAMYNKNLFSAYGLQFGKDIIIASLIIGFMGYLMHPLLEMSLVGTILFVVGYILGLIVVNYMIGLLTDVPLFQRNMGGVFLLSVYGMGLLSGMIGMGFVTLSQSIRDTYTLNTVKIPGLYITDVEFVAIVLFSFLLIAVVKYFTIVSRNNISVLKDDEMTFQGFRSLLMK